MIAARAGINFFYIHAIVDNNYVNNNYPMNNYIMPLNYGKTLECSSTNIPNEYGITFYRKIKIWSNWKKKMCRK